MAQRAVYKNTAVEFLDDMFSGTPEELRTSYANSLALLEATAEEPLTVAANELAQDGELPDDIGDVATFEEGWISDSGRLAGKNVDLVLRHAYGEAIRLASERDTPVPIDTLWITTGKEDDDFEIHVCDSRDRVTLLMFIPLDRDYGSSRARTQSWVIRSGGGDDVDAEVIADGDPPVVKLQRSGRPSSAA